MKEVKIYFDTEFTGLTQNTTLISIGLISESNDIFYAEFTDYDKSQVNPWIQENVINSLYLEKLFNGPIREFGKNNIYFRGDSQNIANTLMMWLTDIKVFNEASIVQFVSDVCHYDFVLLMNLLFDNALNAPHWVSSYCHDINQDIAKVKKISDSEAFDLNREKLAYKYISDMSDRERLKSFDTKIKHNALWDANIIKIIGEHVGKKKSDVTEVAYEDPLNLNIFENDFVNL